MKKAITNTFLFSSEEKKVEFISFCIEMYAEKYNKSGLEIALLFEDKGVFDYLNKGYDMLHTQGKNYIVFEIEKFLEGKC
ncbi:MAG: DUF3791 domain-containing protein [Sphaerochaetaceae bacterium]|nr:DUF3791 domain-containing protein [Sphaerochaetaceae bacterium]